MLDAEKFRKRRYKYGGKFIQNIEKQKNTYGCQYFTEKSLYDLSDKINQFLAAPIKNDLRVHL